MQEWWKAITSNCVIGFNQCFFQFCYVATIAIIYKIILPNFAYRQKIKKSEDLSILLLLLAAYWSYRICWFPFENSIFFQILVIRKPKKRVNFPFFENKFTNWLLSTAGNL
jgi:hypothetical protein